MMVVMFVGVGLLLYLLRRSTGGWGYADKMCKNGAVSAASAIISY